MEVLASSGLQFGVFVGLPVTVVVGDRDQVDHEDALEEVFARFLPQATFRWLRGVGHLITAGSAGCARRRLQCSAS